MNPKTTSKGLVTEVIQYIAGAIIFLFGLIMVCGALASEQTKLTVTGDGTLSSARSFSSSVRWLAIVRGKKKFQAPKIRSIGKCGASGCFALWRQFNRFRTCDEFKVVANAGERSFGVFYEAEHRLPQDFE